MRGARLAPALFLIFAASSLMSDPVSAREFSLAALPAGTTIDRVAYRDLPGWHADDHAASFSAFLGTCSPILDGSAALRDALVPPDALKEACRVARALAAGRPLDHDKARTFFEGHFEAFDIRPESGAGFLTGYFEPEIEASLEKTPAFLVPVLGRPADLVTLKQGEIQPGLDPVLQAARLGVSGLEPFPDRAAVWAGALDGQNLEIAWLRDHAELFITQVQGSARLLLPGGRRARLVYAGRNGHPYTSVGRKIVETGTMTLEEMTLAKLMAWLRADPVRGRALMEQNRSYVFFARDDHMVEDRGPIGGAGVPLMAGRSLAVDRTLWPYGLPVFIEVDPLTPEGPRERIRRLMIAQDTGSAIVGPARGDFFVGSGAAAGERAGMMRDKMRFIVLLPRGLNP